MRGQGTLEYLLIVSAVILIAAVVIVVLLPIVTESSGSKDVARERTLCSMNNLELLDYTASYDGVKNYPKKMTYHNVDFAYNNTCSGALCNVTDTIEVCRIGADAVGQSFPIMLNRTEKTFYLYLEAGEYMYYKTMEEIIMPSMWELTNFASSFNPAPSGAKAYCGTAATNKITIPKSAKNDISFSIPGITPENTKGIELHIQQADNPYVTSAGKSVIITSTKADGTNSLPISIASKDNSEQIIDISTFKENINLNNPADPADNSLTISISHTGTLTSSKVNICTDALFAPYVKVTYTA